MKMQLNCNLCILHLKIIWNKLDISGTKQSLSIWKLKKDPNYMVIRRVSPDSKRFEFIKELYTFKKDVGSGSQAFCVSKQGSSGKEESANIVRKGQDVVREGETIKFNFWAFQEWEPGLMVFY